MNESLAETVGRVMAESPAETQSRREAAPWPKVRLGEICEIRKGQAITKRESNPGLYPVILGGREPAYFIDRFNHTGKAMVISRSGASAGYVSRWNEPIFVTDGFLIEPKENCTFDYLYYTLKCKQQQLFDLKRGSAIPHVTPSLIATVYALLPPLSIQHAIAGRLAAYDDLIENNTRRIAILERKAEQLYKEWFVRRRGIGNINGWHKGKLGDVCYLKRGKNITSSEMKPGNIPVIAAGLEPSGYHDNANVHGVSITMSSSGANAGFIGIHYSDIWAADCAYASEGDTPNIYFAYEVLNNLRPVIDNFKMGAAQPHVYPKHINAIKIEIPPESLMAEANNRLATIHCLIANLQKQNALLSRQRDLLLPRLMSGRLKP